MLLFSLLRKSLRESKLTFESLWFSVDCVHLVKCSIFRNPRTTVRGH